MASVSLPETTNPVTSGYWCPNRVEKDFRQFGSILRRCRIVLIEDEKDGVDENKIELNMDCQSDGENALSAAFPL